jgi:hypothetical protein
MINRLNKQLEEILKGILIALGHYKTGALYQSIKFTTKVDSRGRLDISFQALEYIWYIKDGYIIDKFTNSIAFQVAIENYYVEYVESLLDQFQGV